MRRAADFIHGLQPQTAKAKAAQSARHDKAQHLCRIRRSRAAGGSIALSALRSSECVSTANPICCGSKARRPLDNSDGPMAIDDEIRRIMEVQDMLRRAADPLADARRLARFDQSPATEYLRREEEQRRLLSGAVTITGLSTLDLQAMTRLTGGVDDHRRLLGGAIDDYRRFAAHDPATAAARGVVSAIDSYERYEHLFRRPEFSETARLAQEALAGPKLYGFEPPPGMIVSAMNAMQSPWLNDQFAIDSARGFTSLYAIGHAISTRSPFDDTLSAGLREALGDWRRVTTLPEAIFNDPIARFDFYVELGFDPALTDFPSAAFEEGVVLAGFTPLPDDDDEEAAQEETGLARTNAAHRRLVRFERKLRRFIVDKMTAKHGPGWERHKVPGTVLTAWREKKAKGETTGEPETSIIAYAEFADYLSIIDRTDNWNDVFGAVFARREDVRESFTRLFPVRNCVMHGRLITQEDELYMVSETTRILGAIERKP
jgi:hypothetical protein